MLSSTRRRLLVPAAIVMALAVAPLLTACGGNPLQNIVENATGGNLDLGGTDVPDDFPSDVPLAQGEVVFGASIGSDEERIWNVTVKVGSIDVMDQIAEQLTGLGFEQVSLGGSSDGGKTGIFTKEPLTVLVVTAADDENGFIASYTVTKSSEGS